MSALKIRNALNEWEEVPMLKGDTGDSGVHVGAEAPTDENKNVWIDIDDNNTLQFPTITSEDNGKVLTVVNGQWGLSDGSDKKEDGRILVYEGTIETSMSMGNTAYFGFYTGLTNDVVRDKIYLTMDGIEYTIPRAGGNQDRDAMPMYGELSNASNMNGMPIFTTYPAVLAFDTSNLSNYQLFTQKNGTYQVKIEVDANDDSDGSGSDDSLVITIDTVAQTSDKTFNEIYDAKQADKIIYMVWGNQKVNVTLTSNNYGSPNEFVGVFLQSMSTAWGEYLPIVLVKINSQNQVTFTYKGLSFSN